MSNANGQGYKFSSYLEEISDLLDQIQGNQSSDEQDWVMNKWKKATQRLYEISSCAAEGLEDPVTKQVVRLTEEERAAVDHAFEKVRGLKGQVKQAQAKYGKSESGQIGADEPLPEEFNLDLKNLKRAISSMTGAKFHQNRIRDQIKDFGKKRERTTGRQVNVIPTDHPIKLDLWKAYFERKYVVTMKEVRDLRAKEALTDTEVARLEFLESNTLPKLDASFVDYRIDADELLKKEGLA